MKALKPGQTVVLEATDADAGEHWVTINGNHVLLSGDGEILTGPMKGTKLSDRHGAVPKDSPSEEDIERAISAFPKELHNRIRDTLRSASLDDKIINRLVTRHGANREQLIKLRDIIAKRREDRGRISRLIAKNNAERRAAIGQLMSAKYGEPKASDRSEAKYYDVPVAGTRRIIRIRVADHAPIYGNSQASIYVNYEGPTHPSHYGFVDDVRLVNAKGREPKDVMADIERHFNQIAQKSPKPLNESARHNLSAIRSAGEADIESLMQRLDARHKKLLRQAIKDYGGVENVPDSVWKELRFNTEDALASAILLLLLNADDVTTERMTALGFARKPLSSEELAAYAMASARQATETAASTTDTLRSRLIRKVQDQALTGPGRVGTATQNGIDAALDDVFSQSRRETIAIDSTTQGMTAGQRGAAERMGGDGAEVGGQPMTIELLWRTERDNLVCPRCAPLEGQPEEIWGRVFPAGPGPDAHPNCRCELEVRAVPFNEER